MTHRRRARPLAFTLGTLLLTGCTSQAPVQLDVAPAASTDAPTPLTSDPELVIDEDGCATDVATGIVVACHDPAAGPDDD